MLLATDWTPWVTFSCGFDRLAFTMGWTDKRMGKEIRWADRWITTLQLQLGSDQNTISYFSLAMQMTALLLLCKIVPSLHFAPPCHPAINVLFSPCCCAALRDAIIGLFLLAAVWAYHKVIIMRVRVCHAVSRAMVSDALGPKELFFAIGCTNDEHGYKTPPHRWSHRSCPQVPPQTTRSLPLRGTLNSYGTLSAVPFRLEHA